MRTRHPRSQPNRQILEEASIWFVDFRIGDIDSAAREEFYRWLQRSPDHIQAYLEIVGTYAELPLPKPAGKLDVQALIAHARSSPDDNVIPLDVPRSGIPGVSGPSLSTLGKRNGARDSGKGEAPHARRRTARAWPAIAAAILISALVLSTWIYAQRGTYSTQIGEQRSLTLADGSTVELNSHSSIRVHYTEHERHIDLSEGQALFHVAKNEARPFIVRTDDTRVRAVGTQFDVYRKRTGTVVTVVEGRVAVIGTPSAFSTFTSNAEKEQEDSANARNGSAESDRLNWALSATDEKNESSLPPLRVRGEVARRAGEVFLAAGEQLIITQASIAKPTHANVAAATAWTTRQLIFDATPLTEVAEEFNRYSPRRLVIDGRQLGDFHISGTYSSTNPDSLLRFLRAQPGVKLVETDREIHVTRE